MDPRIVSEKLESLRRCVRRVEAKRPATLDALRGDLDAQDIVSVNLTRAVQICVDVAAHLTARLDVPAPETMAGTFDALLAAGVLPADVAARMKAAVGFRNVAVHAYTEINWAVVFAIVHTRLDDFRAFAGAVAGFAETDSTDTSTGTSPE